MPVCILHVQRFAFVVIIEPCRACAANHGRKLSVFIPLVAVCGTSTGFACAQSVGVIGVGPCRIALRGGLHLPAFPGEGVGRTVVVGQRIADGIVGDGLAVIGGQTVFSALWYLILLSIYIEFVRFD